MNNKKKKESIISTPIRWYGLILLIAIIFLSLSCIIIKKTGDEKNWWGLLLLNFGYGTFASLIVSLLIDIGNTKRGKEEKNNQYMFWHSNLISESKSLGKMLMFAVDKYSKDKVDSEKEYNLEELIDAVLKKDSLREKRIEILKNCIDKIKTQCNNLKENAIYFNSNPKITDEYIDNLKMIIKICTSINFRTTSAYINQDINEKEIKKFIMEKLIPAIDKITDNKISNYYQKEVFKKTKVIMFL